MYLPSGFVYVISSNGTDFTQLSYTAPQANVAIPASAAGTYHLYFKDTNTSTIGEPSLNTFTIASSDNTPSDNTPPTISAVTPSPTTPTNGSVTVSVTASDSGSGIPATGGYSFDGGSTWQNSNSKVYAVNTTIPANSIKVKDTAGNIATYGTQIEITNIDTTAPTLIAGAVNRTGNTAATVKFTSDEAGSYYYEVVANGASAPSIVTTGIGTTCIAGENTITNPTGLTAGAKDIYIKVKDAAGNVSNVLKIDISAYLQPVQVNNNSSNNNTPESVKVIVNGVEQAAVTATIKKVEDRTITTVTVDNNKIDEKLNTGGNNATIVIPVNNDSDVVIGQLNGQTIKNMEAKEAVLEIKTANVTYTLSASEINIDNVSQQIGKQVELKDIAVNVIISAPPQDTVKIVEDTANKKNYQVVVRPVDFQITCTSGDKTVEVSKFNSYVERTVAIPDGVDPSKITTGIVLNTDGTFSHVPTTITVIDGKYYAKINSLSNSIYSVIWNPVTYKDMISHWANDYASDMGSRLIMDGTVDGMFEPDRVVTRAEFVSTVIKALGLMRSGAGKDIFKDVSKDAWYYDAVTIAYEYGIIGGYGNGNFGSMDIVTREQAMTIMVRAMKITKLEVQFKEGEAQELLSKYIDSDQASAWAKENMSICLKSGIFTGRPGEKIAPKDSITRAEVAVIISRLLQKSKLI